MIARSPSMGIIYQHVLIDVFYLVFSTVLHLDQELLPRPSILGLELVGINPFSMRPERQEDSLQISELGIVEGTQSLVHPAVIVNINLCRNCIFKSWKSLFGQRTIIEQFRRQQQHNQGNQRDEDDFFHVSGNPFMIILTIVTKPLRIAHGRCNETHVRPRSSTASPPSSPGPVYSRKRRGEGIHEGKSLIRVNPTYHGRMSISRERH